MQYTVLYIVRVLYVSDSVGSCRHGALLYLLHQHTTAQQRTVYRIYNCSAQEAEVVTPATLLRLGDLCHSRHLVGIFPVVWCDDTSEDIQVNMLDLT